MTLVSDGSEWPDFLLPPRVASTIIEDSATITGPNEDIVTVQSADLDTGLWVITVVNSGSVIGQFSITNDTLAPGESAPVSSMTFSAYDSNPLVLPVSATAPYMRLVAVAVSSYPSDVYYKYVSRSGIPSTIGLGGTVPNTFYDFTVPATDYDIARPSRCTPGIAQLFMSTTATVWSLDLRVYIGTSFKDFRIASNTAALAVGQRIVLPASAYAFVLTNGDASSKAFVFSAIIEP